MLPPLHALGLSSLRDHVEPLRDVTDACFLLVYSRRSSAANKAVKDTMRLRAQPHANHRAL